MLTLCGLNGIWPSMLSYVSFLDADQLQVNAFVLWISLGESALTTLEQGVGNGGQGHGSTDHGM